MSSKDSGNSLKGDEHLKERVQHRALPFWESDPGTWKFIKTSSESEVSGRKSQTPAGHGSRDLSTELVWQLEGYPSQDHMSE